MRARSWSRTGRLTIRARIAVLNAMVFLTGALILLALNWFSVRQIIASRGRAVLSVPATREPLATTGPSAAGPTVTPLLTTGPASPAGTPSAAVASDQAVAPGQGVVPDQAERFRVFEDAALHDLLARSLLAVLVITVVCLLAGWWVSRRALARLSALTATARSIGDDSLHARIALGGPRDEVKDLADSFDAMLDRLERSFTEQRRFTAHASHELRTPLTVQRTALEIPLARGLVPAELEPHLRRALAAVARSERLIASLLALARGESGLLHPVPADLADHVRDALAEILPEAHDGDVTVDAQLDPAPVTGDPALLPQVAGNLIANAVRHNHRGGHVRVATGTRDGRSYLEVTNTGPVVAPEELPTLFEPFRRGTHGSRGSGLGLPVARAITESHGGTLITRADPKGGLRVRADLPSGRG